MSTYSMQSVIGGDVLKIRAPQDRQYLLFVVKTEDGEVSNVRFSNTDNTPIKIDFSDLDIHIIYDPDAEITSLGEFEYVTKIDGGYEIFGDFGIIWVFCDYCSPKL